MFLSANLTGDKEIQKAMRRLPGKIQKKVLRAAIRSAMGPMLKEAKRTAPVESGALRDSLKISIKAFPPHHMVGKVWAAKNFVVGFWPEGSSKPERRIPRNYIRLVELGHHIIRKGAWLGQIPASRFILRSFHKALPEAVPRFRKSYLRGAQREWKKMTTPVIKARTIS